MGFNFSWAAVALLEIVSVPGEMEQKTPLTLPSHGCTFVEIYLHKYAQVNELKNM